MSSNRPPYWKRGDVEEGSETRPLYPMMLERPELRWAFVRKIYTIVSIQLLLTIAVSSLVVFVKPISYFFVSSGAGLGLYIFLIILPFIMMWPLYNYYQRHPINLLLLGLFTVSISFAVGLTCAFTNAKRGHDFSFLGPFLFGAVIILMLFAIIQLFFPMGKISNMIYGGLASLVFCGYIIFDTDNLIKRYGYDEYIWAAVALYLDIINLFLSLLNLFRAADN
ncbi:hypothetical protein M5K25_005542 [Dendrobium thyrsiflorum]|uniref:BI1-like protein n=1 Tax=Dendrobium thyrsiflorum TaxID=117978 RepID=A0ABD0VHS7_DENTH